MQNRDLKARFDDWLLNPVEELDWEVKRWLDMSNPESEGTIAKELIALENHGGGFLVIGFDDSHRAQLVADEENRPSSLDCYGGDKINAIVRGRAEPAFHVEVTLQGGPGSGLLFPVCRVTGSTKVPVRSRSETAKVSTEQHVLHSRARARESPAS